jgi:hypothetical protein
MRTHEFERSCGESLKDIEAMLEGRVFHVTMREFWPGIVSSGEIAPNTHGQRQSTFASSNSYFRKRGCVSLFDYRKTPDDELVDYRLRCWPFQQATSGDGISILVLLASIYPMLIPWTAWRDEQALHEMVVPYVEVGHKGPIPIAAIESIVHLKRNEVEGSLAWTVSNSYNPKSAG